jgi:hypothetical protein
MAESREEKKKVEEKKRNPSSHIAGVLRNVRRLTWRTAPEFETRLESPSATQLMEF